MSDTKKRLAVYRPLILARLQEVLTQHQDTRQHPKWHSTAHRQLEAYTGGGKLLRGSLLCYAYELCGGQPVLPPAVLDAATALELMQAALLIHDDIIDRDDIRRGQPAMHVQYRQLVSHEAVSEAARLGDNLALCAGDMTLFTAFSLLSQASPGTRGSRLIGLFADTLADVAAGQMQDVYLGAREHCPPKWAIYEVMRYKTAAYSVALPLCAGAVLAGQPTDLQHRLYDIGLTLGTIYQIKDDELGVFGNSAQLGKPVGADVREGKKTLLYYYLWQAADPAERRQLRTLFGNTELTADQLESVRQAMRRHGIPDRLRQDMQQLADKAEKHISQLALSPTALAQLRSLGDLLADRQR